VLENIKFFPPLCGLHVTETSLGPAWKLLNNLLRRRGGWSARQTATTRRVEGHNNFFRGAYRLRTSGRDERRVLYVCLSMFVFRKSTSVNVGMLYLFCKPGAERQTSRELRGCVGRYRVHRVLGYLQLHMDKSPSSYDGRRVWESTRRRLTSFATQFKAQHAVIGALESKSNHLDLGRAQRREDSLQAGERQSLRQSWISSYRGAWIASYLGGCSHLHEWFGHSEVVERISTEFRVEECRAGAVQAAQAKLPSDRHDACISVCL